MSARGRLTCRDAMLCLRRSHWVFCLALYISSLAPAPGEALAHPGLAYVVSPPPATRQMMPNYLPKLPPESTARVPRVSAHSAPRLRAGCRSCRLRPRHIRRCAHCRHGVENPSASRRHHRAGHRAHHRHGHFGQHQRHVPRHHKRALNDRSRSAPRRSQSMLCSLAPCRNAMDEVRRCLRTEIFTDARNPRSEPRAEQRWRNLAGWWPRMSRTTVGTFTLRCAKPVAVFEIATPPQ
jgi:hypothetical protein